MMQNIDKGAFGMEYLKPDLEAVHDLYKSIGGKLSLDEVLAMKWETPY